MRSIDRSIDLPKDLDVCRSGDSSFRFVLVPAGRLPGGLITMEFQNWNVVFEFRHYFFHSSSSVECRP
jgi:hypothetical protein